MPTELDGTAWRWQELSATLEQASSCRLEKLLNRSGMTTLSNFSVSNQLASFSVLYLQIHAKLKFIFLQCWRFHLGGCHLGGCLVAAVLLHRCSAACLLICQFMK